MILSPLRWVLRRLAARFRRRRRPEPDPYVIAEMPRYARRCGAYTDDTAGGTR